MSCACKSASTFAPSAITASHRLSVKGLVIRTASAMRLTVIAKSKLTSAGSAMPLIGAADL